MNQQPAWHPQWYAADDHHHILVALRHVVRGHKTAQVLPRCANGDVGHGSIIAGVDVVAAEGWIRLERHTNNRLEGLEDVALGKVRVMQEREQRLVVAPHTLRHEDRHVGVTPTALGLLLHILCDRVHLLP